MRYSETTDERTGHRTYGRRGGDHVGCGVRRNRPLPDPIGPPAAGHRASVRPLWIQSARFSFRSLSGMRIAVHRGRCGQGIAGISCATMDRPRVDHAGTPVRRRLSLDVHGTKGGHGTCKGTSRGPVSKSNAQRAVGPAVGSEWPQLRRIRSQTRHSRSGESPAVTNTSILPWKAAVVRYQGSVYSLRNTFGNRVMPMSTPILSVVFSGGPAFALVVWWDHYVCEGRLSPRTCTEYSY